MAFFIKTYSFLELTVAVQQRRFAAAADARKRPAKRAIAHEQAYDKACWTATLNQCAPTESRPLAARAKITASATAMIAMALSFLANSPGVMTM